MPKRLSLLLLIGLFLPFANKPIHIDDANFLAMAKQAAESPWRPHDFLINWSGTTESAFNVLSNPPGIALWLAPVSHQPVFWMHLWMLPWLLLAVWGAGRMGARIAGRPAAAILLIVGAPVSMIATSALTPDLPLLALSLAGMGALIDSDKPFERRTGGALMLGLTVWFRYSGIALLPLAFLWPWMHGDRRAAIRLGAVALAPLAVLSIHDILAYDAVHLASMVSFQSTANTPLEFIHKGVATLAALGGAAALPFLALHRPGHFIVGAAIGAAVGFSAATIFGQTGTPLLATVIFSAAGGASLGGAAKLADNTDRLLWAWLGIGLIFLTTLRFSASRYLIPFFAPALLLSLRGARPALIRVSAIAGMLVGLGVSLDDLDLAQVQQQAAAHASATGKGRIAGHWGFQHHLLAAGWTDIEEDELLPPGTWVAMSAQAWPQLPINTCWDFMELRPLSDRHPGIRVMSKAGGANLHGHMLAASPPIPVFAPWTLANDSMEQLTIRRTCP